MWRLWTKTQYVHPCTYWFICNTLFPQILPAWILPPPNPHTANTHGRNFQQPQFSALTANLGPFPVNLSISQTDDRSDGSPVLFGSFVHRGHAHLAVTLGPPVVTQGLVLRGGERKRQCENRAKKKTIEAKHLDEQLVIWKEKKQNKKQVSHQVFNGFLVLVYFSERLVVPLDFIDVLSQILQTQQQRAKDENWQRRLFRAPTADLQLAQISTSSTFCWITWHSQRSYR